MVFNISEIKELKYDFQNYDELIDFYKNISETFYKDNFIYTEKHHIVPRCMNGDNSKKNIIKLPWMIHILAHYLLAKQFEKSDSQLAVKNFYAVRMILDQDKVSSRIDNFEELKNQSIIKAIELETINRLNCKRIYINKDSKTIQIFADNFEVFEKQGWKKGRIFKNGKGKVWINNGKKSTYIPVEQLEDFLNSGWKRGMFRTENMKNYDRGKSLPRTKGYKWVHKNDKRLLVSPIELNNYLQTGWSMGSGIKTHSRKSI